ncbi:MAG: hypothetical protein GVY35_02215 [Bacteroidetes bacterium]|jgi:hypothetical protein|nr:hypothetical protein [Bacteroidota bacterium]
MSAAPSPDRSEDSPDERAPGPRPLSRRASRLFVIASILFVIAATAGSVYYLVSMTSEALNAPMDSVQTDTTAVDTTALPPNPEAVQ